MTPLSSVHQLGTQAQMNNDLELLGMTGYMTLSQMLNLKGKRLPFSVLVIKPHTQITSVMQLVNSMTYSVPKDAQSLERHQLMDMTTKNQKR
mmetsp:Transcript_9299/g.38097  ORF Transcript_9299/g.38097 Transcript_9299/m.38097 type:complete len:92 (+) Transcript_9299:166-441(+)